MSANQTELFGGIPLVSPDEIRAKRTPKGAWTRAQLAEWGVPWPPPAGWRASLERQWRELHPEDPQVATKPIRSFLAGMLVEYAVGRYGRYGVAGAKGAYVKVTDEQREKIEQIVTDAIVRVQNEVFTDP